MDEIEQQIPEEELSFWSQHRFLLLIALTIVISLILVSVGLIVYNVSGAAQLDFSRPGLKAVSNQVVDDSESISDYSALGPVNQATINEFKTLFDTQAKSATAVDAFGGDPLDPSALEF